MKGEEPHLGRQWRTYHIDTKQKLQDRVCYFSNSPVHTMGGEFRIYFDDWNTRKVSKNLEK
jgi:hypothetical protein